MTGRTTNIKGASAGFLMLAILSSLIVACRADLPETTSSPRQESLAIVSVTVIPTNSNHLLHDHTVIVKGDRIVAVGPTGDAPIPDQAKVIDGEGQYLIPGLSDMHGHIPLHGAPSPFVENLLFLFIANGVTTVRSMRGRPGHMRLRDRVLAGEIVGPTLYLAGPIFTERSVRSPEEAERRVRRQFAEGWDLIKIHSGISRASYDRMAVVAHELGMRFGGHVPDEVGILHALEMGQETIEHMDGYIAYLGAEEHPVIERDLRDVARRTAAAGAWVTPTLALWESTWALADADILAGYAELKYMPRNDERSWADTYGERQEGTDRTVSQRVVDTRMRLLKVMHEEGVKILFGTDAPRIYSVPGFAVHREASSMAAAGLTPFQILESATTNAGKYFSSKDDFGTVTVGSRADLVLLSSNPLDDISHLRHLSGVVLRGTWIAESEIRDRLQRIAASYR